MLRSVRLTRVFVPQLARAFSIVQGEPRKIDKVLIANRGEIAMRVLRTGRRLGKKIVAVYSDADANAPHVEHADEAYHIGGSASSDSYLKGDTIIEVAKRAGAQAIHPGYGFLSENAGFAEKCAEAGIVFIGPPPSAIRAMGDKKESKILMENAGVPVVPGYHGDDQSVETLTKEASKIGFPLMIKATMGGGGKGMRVVMEESEFVEKLNSAKREAMSSFADDTVLLERYVINPRHVEVQVFGDEHGDAVYLYERDCSVQRRHQKVLEESPAPKVTEEFRHAIGRAAVDAAKAVGYYGAGTVEFVVGDALDFYFMEMNTRLQVEHPVTELVTRQDLVEWQLTVAQGQPLPMQQADIPLVGHALEARIYAETPDNDFLPGAGTVSRLQEPVGQYVRVDTGVREGDAVGVFYDPMIAKLIVWGENRDQALTEMDQALKNFLLAGLPTNINFLKNCVTHPEFQEGGVSTDFIPKNKNDLLPAKMTGLTNELVLSAVGYCLQQDHSEREISRSSSDPHSPWATQHGFRANLNNTRKLEFVDGDSVVDVKVHYNWDGSFNVEGADRTAVLKATMTPEGVIHATIGNVTYHAEYFLVKRNLHLWHDGTLYTHTVVLPDVDSTGAGSASGSVKSPMAGKIVNILVQPGDSVDAGDAVVVMEAMKMEHTLTAPAAGVVESVFGKVGEVVDGDKPLVVFEQ